MYTCVRCVSDDHVSDHTLAKLNIDHPPHTAHHSRRRRALWERGLAIFTLAFGSSLGLGILAIDAAQRRGGDFLGVGSSVVGGGPAGGLGEVSWLIFWGGFRLADGVDGAVQPSAHPLTPTDRHFTHTNKQYTHTRAALLTPTTPPTRPCPTPPFPRPVRRTARRRRRHPSRCVSRVGWSFMCFACLHI